MNQLPVSFRLTFQEVTGVISPPAPVNGSINFINPSTGTWRFKTGVGGIPTLGGAWGLVAMILAMLGVGIYATRRRRAAALG